MGIRRWNSRYLATLAFSPRSSVMLRRVRIVFLMMSFLAIVKVEVLIPVPLEISVPGPNVAFTLSAEFL